MLNKTSDQASLSSLDETITDTIGSIEVRHNKSEVESTISGECTQVPEEEQNHNFSGSSQNNEDSCTLVTDENSNKIDREGNQHIVSNILFQATGENGNDKNEDNIVNIEHRKVLMMLSFAVVSVMLFYLVWYNNSWRFEYLRVMEENEQLKYSQLQFEEVMQERQQSYFRLLEELQLRHEEKIQQLQNSYQDKVVGLDHEEEIERCQGAIVHFEDEMRAFNSRIQEQIQEQQASNLQMIEEKQAANEEETKRWTSSYYRLEEKMQRVLSQINETEFHEKDFKKCQDSFFLIEEDLQTERDLNLRLKRQLRQQKESLQETRDSLMLFKNQAEEERSLNLQIQEQLQEEQDSNQNLKDELKYRKASFNRLKDDVQKMQVLDSQLQQQIQEKQASNDYLEKEKQKWESSYLYLEEEMQDLLLRTSEIKNIREKEQEQKDSCERLNQDILEHRASNFKLQKQIQEKQTENLRLKEEVRNWRSSYKLLEEEMQELLIRTTKPSKKGWEDNSKKSKKENRYSGMNNDCHQRRHNFGSFESKKKRRCNGQQFPWDKFKHNFPCEKLDGNCFKEFSSSVMSSLEDIWSNAAKNFATTTARNRA